MTIIVNAHQLWRALFNARVCRLNDPTLEVLGRVVIEVNDGHLVAVATNRVLLGIAHAEVEEGSDSDTFQLAEGATDALIRLAKTKVRDQAWRTIRLERSANNHMTATPNDGERTNGILMPLVDEHFDGAFPRWRRLLPTTDDVGDEIAPDFALSREQMGLVAKLIAPDQFRFTRRGNHTPWSITVGEHFTGVLMPQRPDGEVPPVQPDWLRVTAPA